MNDNTLKNLGYEYMGKKLMDLANDISEVGRQIYNEEISAWEGNRKLSQIASEIRKLA